MEDEYWYWGTTDRSFVDTCLNNESDGAFLVFRDEDSKLLILAYRRDDRNLYVDIIFIDHYYGFTEPLGFESLSDLLDAFNCSPATENYLVEALPRPNAQGDDHVDAIELLLTIRLTDKQISDKSEDVEQKIRGIRQIDGVLKGLQTKASGLNKVGGMIENQIKRHLELSRRMSLGGVANTSTQISDNYERLLDRQCKVREAKSEIESIISLTDKEKLSLLQEYNTHMFSINSLQEQQADDKRQLLLHFPELRDFVECLLQEISQTSPDPTIHDIRNGEAEKRLRGQPDGTFLVRISRKTEEIPFVLSVCLNGTVVHFPVYRMHGYYGFNETLCIFESVMDLVTKYAVIPFSIHGEQYGNLNLHKELSRHSNNKQAE